MTILRFFIPIALAGAASALFGCLALGGKSCTDEARSSVTVTVVDGSGAKVRDAKVTFTLNGGPSQEAMCLGPGDAQCDSWVTTWEQAGTFVVTAKSADGTKTDTKSAVVSSGECHVNGVTMTLTLK